MKGLPGVVPQTLRSAWQHARQQRPIIYPNPGFRRKIFALEVELYDKESISKDEVMIQSLMGKGLQLQGKEAQFDRDEVLLALVEAQAKHDPEYSACYALQQAHQKRMIAQIKQRRKRSAQSDTNVSPKRHAAEGDTTISPKGLAAEGGCCSDGHLQPANEEKHVRDTIWSNSNEMREPSNRVRSISRH